jgi:amphi-Trp domain-containing protein
VSDLLQHEEEAPMSREAAAERLRALADQLARHNEVAIVRDGIRYSVKVPNEVRFTFEVEVGDDGSEIEVEIKW